MPRLRRRAPPPRRRRARDRSARRCGSPSGVTRSRAVPGGTVGGRIACASTPRSSSASAKRHRPALSPTRTGTMCVSPPRAKPERARGRAQASRVPPQRRPALGLGVDHVERRARRRDRRRRQPGRVDEAARAVHQQVDERARPGDVRAGAAERLAERAHVDGDVAPSARPPPRDRRRGPQHAGGVGLVQHHAAVICSGRARRGHAAGPGRRPWRRPNRSR